ncbi:MAG: M48 family metalloprotease [Desulfobacteraceae bacterium]|nr:M48 family metalloprotease [Desulfobacteraceae bacterium]
MIKQMKLIKPNQIVIILVILMLPVLAFGGRLRVSQKNQSQMTMQQVQAEIRFGKDLAARILGNYQLWDNDKVNHYVNLVGHALALYSSSAVPPFSFGVLDSEELNAFATPGGYIFITRGALLRMENESELACVLGHEMAHVIKRHMVKEINLKTDAGSAMGGLAGLIGGATGAVRGSLESSLDTAMNLLFNRGYKLKDEMEADGIGMLIAAVAGYDPRALEAYLRRVEHFETAPQTKRKDYPVLADRLESIENALRNNGLTGLSLAKMEARFNEMVMVKE